STNPGAARQRHRRGQAPAARAPRRRDEPAAAEVVETVGAGGPLPPGCGAWVRREGQASPTHSGGPAMPFDAFVYFDGKSSSGLEVKGESTDDVYSKKKAFEIHSFSLGASNPVTIGSATEGSGGGKVSVSSFNVMKKTDSASAALFRAC